MRSTSFRIRAVVVALLTGITGLAACGGVPADPPLPRAWQQTGQESRPTVGSAPLWGVPAFEAPSRSDCHGPARLQEQPGWDGGGAANRWGATAPAPAVAEARGRELAKSGAVAADRVDAPAMMGAPPPLAVPVVPPVAMRQAAPTPVAPQTLMPPSVPVTAGMVDDNADFGEYLAYRERHGDLGTRDRDISERYRVDVRDADGRPLPDAELALSWPGAREGLLWGRTDAGGHAWLHPAALVDPQRLAGLERLEVQVRSGRTVARVALQRGQKQAVQLSLPVHAAQPARVPLDLVFLVDATGSMGDEIAKLKTSMHRIAAQVASLPSHPDLCLGLVAYRDRGDEYLWRMHDLTDRLGDFQHSLDALQASGGGDEPEALSQALHEVVHRISWRGGRQPVARLVVLVSDAPPHLDYGTPYYDQDTAAALAKGIKLHAVGASGLNPQGEAVFRQMAQYTGGRFVFLTYKDAADPGSGPGSETVHDVKNYSVQTLDQLIVRLVKEELAAGQQPS
jgi:Mg-chelatase subunit ChlD